MLMCGCVCYANKSMTKSVKYLDIGIGRKLLVSTRNIERIEFISLLDFLNNERVYPFLLGNLCSLQDLGDAESQKHFCVLLQKPEPGCTNTILQLPAAQTER